MAGIYVSLKNVSNGLQTDVNSEKLALPAIITTAISMSVRFREFINVDVWMFISTLMGNVWDLNKEYNHGNGKR